MCVHACGAKFSGSERDGARCAFPGRKFPLPRAKKPRSRQNRKQILVAEARESYSSILCDKTSRDDGKGREEELALNKAIWRRVIFMEMYCGVIGARVIINLDGAWVGRRYAVSGKFAKFFGW